MSTKRPILAAFMIAASVSLAHAHSGAKGVVKVRMDTMVSIAAEMKAISAQLKTGQLDHDALAVSAGRLKKHAARIPEEFESETITNVSEALPAIWDEFETFAAIASRFENRAERLADLAGSGAELSELKAAFAAMGKTCGTCHRDYRKPK